MKRFVRSDFGAGAIIAVLTLAVVALTGASAGATYLIAIGFTALLSGSERLQLWREERQAGRRPSKALLDAGRSKGSR